MPETIPAAPPVPNLAGVAPAPLTLTDLKKRRPPYRDAPVGDLGTFRLHRLDSSKRLEVRKKIASVLDSGKVTEEDKDAVIACFVGVICTCLGGDFDTDEGRENVGLLTIEELTELVRMTSLVNGLGIEIDGNSEQEEIDEVKNE